MGFFSRIFRRKTQTTPKDLGPVFIKPSEATPSNIKAITSSGNTATVVSGSINNPTKVSYVRTSRGGYTKTDTPSQTQFQQEQTRQREAEKKRQEELKKAADEREKEKTRKKQSAERAAENKRLADLAARANIEKKIKAEEKASRNTTIRKQLELLKKKQQEQRPGLYIPKVDKFGKSEAFYVQQQAERDIKDHISSVTKILEDKVRRGSLSVNKANEILNKEADKKYNQIVEEIERKYPPAEINYKLDIPIRKGKEKFIDKAIAKLETLSGEEGIKAEKKGQELIANRKELEKLLGLVDKGTISDEDLARIKKVSRKRMELTLSSFGQKAISRLSDTALGLALLTKVPGLVSTKEGRKIIAAEVVKIPNNIKIELKKFGKLYKTNPEQAAAIVATDILLFKASGAVFKQLGKVSKATINKVKNLSPTLLKIEKAIIRIKKPLPSGKRLTLKVGTIADVKEGIAKQFKRGGKQLTAVTAQADKVIRGIRGRAIIRKPFSFDEKKLSKVTRDLLKKFDKGKISPRQTLTLNKLLREETKRLGVQTKGVDLLERSMYFDPDRTLRKSRLAAGAERVPEEGTLFDLLTGKASLFNRTPKPTIYVIEEFAEKLPKTKEFASITRKIKAAVKAGKDPNLTKTELAKLTRWQVTPSGKLKPIGSTTYQGGLEREVTIAPGEVIKRVKKLGTLKVGNQRVPIYAIKILKGKIKIGKIKKIKKVSSSISELRKRKSKLKTKSAKTNLDKKIKSKVKELENIKKKVATKEIKEFLKDSRRRPTKRRKKYPLGRKIAARAVTRKGRPRAKPRARPRQTPRKRPTPRKPTPRKRPTPRKPTPRKRPTPRKPTPRKPTPRKRPTPRTPTRPIGKRKTRVRKPRSRKQKTTQRKGRPEGYNVYVKSKRKLVKVNSLPLKRNDALDRRAYIIDHSTSASAPRLFPISKVKKLGKITPKEKGARSKIKARRYRIVKGRRVSIGGAIIEKKGKPRINTIGEKKGLSAARVAKKLNTPIKRKTSTKKQVRKKKR